MRICTTSREEKNVYICIPSKNGMFPRRSLHQSDQSEHPTNLSGGVWNISLALVLFPQRKTRSELFAWIEIAPSVPSEPRQPRRNGPISISTRLLSRIMNSVRLCIPEKRGFWAIPYRVVGDIYHPLERSSWQTRARGVMQASCARVNRRNSTLLFSFHGSRDPSRGCERTGVAGCCWRVLRRPPTLSQVRISPILVFYARKKPSSPRIRCTFILSRRFFRFSRLEECRERPLALQFCRDFLSHCVVCSVCFVIFIFYNVLLKYWYEI